METDRERALRLIGERQKKPIMAWILIFLLVVAIIYLSWTAYNIYRADKVTVEEIKERMANETLPYNITYGSVRSYEGDWVKCYIKATYPTEPWKDTTGVLWYNLETANYNIVLE